MRALLQRVKEAEVLIDEKSTGKIGRGLLIYLGLGRGDDRAKAQKLWDKIKKLRIFADKEGKTNLNLEEVSGNLIIVSQFTLYASVRKGNRPGFSNSAPPDEAENLYEYFISLAKADFSDLKTGSFGADMKVYSINDGPFTIWIDTDELEGPRRRRGLNDN